MVPPKLREKVVELYETILPRYGEEKIALWRKYNNMMGTEITHGLIPPGGDSSIIITATSRPQVAKIAELSYYLAEGKIPRGMEEEIQRAFRAVKEDSRNFEYETWQAFFEEWRKRLECDKGFEEFVKIRDKAVTLIQEISSEITNDLESEN